MFSLRLSAKTKQIIVMRAAPKSAIGCASHTPFSPNAFEKNQRQGIDKLLSLLKLFASIENLY